MPTLQLTVHKKWFDMISSGVKKEEYRDIKPFWIQRLTWHEFHKCSLYDLLHYQIDQEVFCTGLYDTVCFSNGYAKVRPQATFKLEEIFIGSAKPEWSDNMKGDVFVIKIGKRVNTVSAKSLHDKIKSHR